jgi:hypothetical protein
LARIKSHKETLLEHLKRAFGCLAVLAALAVVLPAQAQVVLVTTRPGIGGNDFLDWGSLGPSGTVVPNPLIAQTNNGMSVTVADAFGLTMERRDQPIGWGGNFSPGEELLWTQGNNGPMTLIFDSLIVAAGANIQANFYGLFGARLEAFDGGGNSLGAVTRNGNSTADNDGSAIFIGIADANGLATIKKIVFSLDYANFGTTGDFAINRVELKTVAGNQGPQVPEPGALALLAGFGVAGALIALRRRH